MEAKAKEADMSQRHGLLFRLEEAAAICEIGPQIIRNWVSRWMVKPAVRGGMGNNNSHQFSAKQLYGLVCIHVLIHSERGCSRDYSRAIFRAFDSMPDSTFEAWVNDREDDYTEEDFAAWIGSTDAAPVFADHGNPKLSSDKLTEAEMLLRCIKIDEAIKARLGQGSGARLDKR
jgi:hypothetical protein